MNHNRYIVTLNFMKRSSSETYRTLVIFWKNCLKIIVSHLTFLCQKCAKIWLLQVIKINDKLFYRHYFVHRGHKLASFSTLVSNQYEKLKKKIWKGPLLFHCTPF